MTEMNMVERVARALEPKCLGFGKGEMPIQIAREFARAAIEAMREPTTEMKFCGIQEEAYGIDATWKAMIDAALKEESP